MILGIQLAMAPYSIAIVESGTVLIEFESTDTAHFAENVSEVIAGLLKKMDRNQAQLKAVGVTSGPGNYTALRIGVTVAKTMSQALHIPVYGFSTLEAMIWPYKHTETLYYAILPAKKSEFNTAMIAARQGSLERVTPDFVTTESAIMHQIQTLQNYLCFVGQFTSEMRSKLDARQHRYISTHPKASGVALMAESAFNNKQNGDWRALNPIYSHQHNAKQR